MVDKREGHRLGIVMRRLPVTLGIRTRGKRDLLRQIEGSRQLLGVAQPSIYLKYF